MVRNSKLIENPLYRFLEREVNLCHSLLKIVRSELSDLKQMALGNL